MEQHKFFVMGDFDRDIAKDLLEWLDGFRLAKVGAVNLQIIINSSGGCVCSCMSMVSAIDDCSHTITTVGMGSISSCGFMLFIAGGHRVLYGSCISMSHQFSWCKAGKQHELEAHGRGVDLTKQILMNLYTRCSGLSCAKVQKLLLPSEDVYLSPKEVMELGLCDEIVQYEELK